MSVIHHDRLMELLFLRDTYDIFVPGIPQTLHPSGPIEVTPSSTRHDLASRIGGWWSHGLRSAAQMPHRALLAYHVFETGSFGPLLRSLTTEPAPVRPGALDSTAFSRWIETLSAPPTNDSALNVDEYVEARVQARKRGLAVIVVLPVATSVATPEGVLIVPDAVYAQPDRLIRVLDDYPSTEGSVTDGSS
ncbi:hypothetical protein [Curtobacterium flaccumfaciens]|uniref:hypothetical protein n=1 Tax=Curtobacterium flaccumfaciens TaxID=2035 RepID=UPI001BDE1FC0|nr:hypothetical protein [Curtobacterium flaccumfaciens]MBT1631563.1 hypothetical protein [Curtobacterium flaccumfaciens pv. oortii]MCS5524745.1 hypothetical protein [Curtobacterium flaccumfaciens pv. oortii]MCX2846871.1 hypothetical protein [Curtobacterium flaccumfaciens pv. oortii]